MGHGRMVIAKDLLTDRYRAPVQALRLVVLLLRQVNGRKSVERIGIPVVVDSELRLRSHLELLCLQQRCSVISTCNELPDHVDIGPLRDRWADKGDGQPQGSKAGADNRSLLWHQVSPQVA